MAVVRTDNDGHALVNQGRETSRQRRSQRRQGDQNRSQSGQTLQDVGDILKNVHPTREEVSAHAQTVFAQEPMLPTTLVHDAVMQVTDEGPHLTISLDVNAADQNEVSQPQTQTEIKESIIMNANTNTISTELRVAIRGMVNEAKNQGIIPKSFQTSDLGATDMSLATAEVVLAAQKQSKVAPPADLFGLDRCWRNEADEALLPQEQQNANLRESVNDAHAKAAVLRNSVEDLNARVDANDKELAALRAAVLARPKVTITTEDPGFDWTEAVQRIGLGVAAGVTTYAVLLGGMWVFKQVFGDDTDI